MIKSKVPFLRASSASLVIGAALLAGPALAQTAALQAAPVTTAGDNADAATTIVVTGSRIARPQAEASVPVAVVSAQSIQNAGQTNLLDALRDLPISGQSLGTSASNFSNSGNGEATINLRNLGSQRTLVLINGRRSVGVPGSPAVDLNTIPVDLIDHVEIATGGASAVYGSDAIAGVVNIFLKNNFSGLSLHAEDMITGQGDGHTPLLSVLAGKDFADGKGHITANLTYTKSDGVSSSNRSYSANDTPSRSSYTPVGIFFDQNGNASTFDQNNNVTPYIGTLAQRYNRNPVRLLTTPVERYTAALLAHYDFSSAAQLYGEFTYNKTKASARVEPLAVDNGMNQGQSVLSFDGQLPTNDNPELTAISTNSPFVPAAILAGAGPDSVLDFRKRSNGIFDRSPTDERDFYRGVIGLKGDLGSHFKYDLSYEHSQVRDDTAFQAILLNNYGAALQATTLNGQIVCTDPVARAAGCVPINPFGTPNYSAAQLKFLSTYTGAGALIPGATPGQHVYSDFLQKNTQDVVSLVITGSLFHLPNGPLGIAFGGEYHREKVTEIYDPFTLSGFSSAQSAGNEVGKTIAKEGFVELNAPIFGGHPGIYAVTLEGAARYSDYNTVGGQWTYKYGGTYAPTPDLRFRAIYARAVRAPNLNELYAGRANTAQTVVDPCDQYQAQGNDTTPIPPLIPLAAGCAAVPGIANYLKTHPNFSYSLAQVQTIFGYSGGNPKLVAEATNTFTAGATFTPRFIRNLIVTADYYSVKVKNAVATVDPQTSVNQCFQTGSPNFCSSVFRDPNGFITQVDQSNVNAASYLVAGIDVQAIYAFRTHFLREDGKVNVDLYYNHKFKQEQTPFAGGAVSNELGAADTQNSQQLGTGFKDQFTFNFDYATGPVSLHYRWKYLGPVNANADGSGPLTHISPYAYHDLQLKFSLEKQFEFYVGCNNLTDKQPPFISGGNSSYTGTNTVGDTYDVLGRTLYAGVTARF
jgi:iron complex outermembrane receptor protein